MVGTSFSDNDGIFNATQLCIVPSVKFQKILVLCSYLVELISSVLFDIVCPKFMGSMFKLYFWYSFL